MKNPFVKDGSTNPNASINKLYIAKAPFKTINENLENKTAGDIFSTKLFIDEIKKHSSNLKIDLNTVEEKKLPQYLSQCLISSNETIRKSAEEITKIFGERLAVILLTLKLGLQENKDSRQDWSNENWVYWSTLKNIILVGGLASGKLGENLKHYINQSFENENIEPYNVILNDDSENIAIKGCTTYIEEVNFTKQYLIMDCGATFIKRSFVKLYKDNKLEINKLSKIKSQNVEWTYKNIEEEREEAFKLHNHILNTILESINNINDINILGKEVIISIANYVNKGLFLNRGGYGKLRLISLNYDKYLEDDLYKFTKKHFRIKFIHDGTAMAAAFKEYENSVCISLGTHFGVGFPL